MRGIRDLEFFKKGDYTGIGKSKFTDADIEAIRKHFHLEKAGNKDFKGIPIIYSLDPNNPHNLEKSVKLGRLTDVWLKTGGIMTGDGYIKDEVGTDIASMLDGKSAGFIRTDQGRALHHIAVTFKENAIIKDLKDNKESIFAKNSKGLEKFEFAEDSKEIEFYEFTEPQKGEDKKSIKKEKKKVTDEIKFSKEYVELEISKAVDAKEAKLKIEFAQKETEFNAKIKTLEDVNKKLKAQNEEFAKKESDRKHEAIKKRIDDCKGLKAEEKPKLLEEFISFANDGISWKSIDKMLAVYENIDPLVDESDDFSHGDRQKKDKGDDDGKGEQVFSIPTRGQAEKIKKATAKIMAEGD